MRKIGRITITEEGRDKDKVFEITELSAAQAEWWALRAFRLLAKSGVDVGENEGLGMQGLVVQGLASLAKIDPLDVKPLLDEMWTCVRIVSDPQKNPTFVRELMDEDIEEVMTLIRLRAEVFTLHTGFSIPGASSTSTTETPKPGSPNTPTSRPRSALLSRQGKQP